MVRNHHKQQMLKISAKESQRQAHTVNFRVYRRQKVVKKIEYFQKSSWLLLYRWLPLFWYQAQLSRTLGCRDKKLALFGHILGTFWPKTGKRNGFQPAHFFWCLLGSLPTISRAKTFSYNFAGFDVFVACTKANNLQKKALKSIFELNDHLPLLNVDETL